MEPACVLCRACVGNVLFPEIVRFGHSRGSIRYERREPEKKDAVNFQWAGEPGGEFPTRRNGQQSASVSLQGKVLSLEQKHLRGTEAPSLFANSSELTANHTGQGDRKRVCGQAALGGFRPGSNPFAGWIIGPGRSQRSLAGLRSRKSKRVPGGWPTGSCPCVAYPRPSGIDGTAGGGAGNCARRG